MAANDNVECDIEHALISVHGKFWSFFIKFLASAGQIDADAFLEAISAFVAESTSVSEMERSIIDTWLRQIKKNGTPP